MSTREWADHLTLPVHPQQDPWVPSVASWCLTRECLSSSSCEATMQRTLQERWEGQAGSWEGSGWRSKSRSPKTKTPGSSRHPGKPGLCAWDSGFHDVTFRAQWEERPLGRCPGGQPRPPPSTQAWGGQAALPPRPRKRGN